MEETSGCSFGGIALTVVVTAVVTSLALVVGSLIYRQWRRNKGKHLVLVTDPEIVEEAYAFDNPCFKDCTPAAIRTLERSTPVVHRTKETSPNSKDHQNRWSAAWANLGFNDKRRTLDDSFLGPKARRVSIVGLKSRDFTGLGFNVCGNMREGIFVKDLLHRGPASESGRIHPGDRISSIKISFRSMVYEDALTILSYASPYDVELEVESGVDTTAKPTTLLKKSVGPSPGHICHPLYRSQSIPELSQPQMRSDARNKLTSKRLFAQDPNDSNYSNYSTLNSTLKSSKSTPGNQTLERRGEELMSNNSKPTPNHHPTKFGIKVLPALDGTVHRVENQNEHNTNLERRNSKKMEGKRHSGNGDAVIRSPITENIQQRSNVSSSAGNKLIRMSDSNGIDVPDRASEIVKVRRENSNSKTMGIPSDVPAEVHNAAVAARKNRKSSSGEQLQKMTQLEQKQDSVAESPEAKSPQKGKRKAPAPPSRNTSVESTAEKEMLDEKEYNNISDYKEPEQTSAHMLTDRSMTKDLDKSLDDKLKAEPKQQERISRSANHRNSESDTDTDIPNSFTTIELNPADITVHHTPVPEATNDDEDENEVYRKAASLGDLSKYENKSSSTLERAQSLDMTDPGSKKRKAPIPPPEDIHESTEDLTKLDQIDTFDRRKLKKSSEWGTLEDAIWTGPGEEPETKSRKKSNSSNGGGTLERSKSNVEAKVTKDDDAQELSMEPLNVSDGALETSIELYNLPLSKKLTQDFIKAERLFDFEEDNALARLVNDGEVVKTPTDEEIEVQFRKSHPLPDLDDDDEPVMELEVGNKSPEVADSFEKAVRYFDMHSKASLSSDTKVNLTDPPEELYAGKKEVVEEPISKVHVVNLPCPGCERRHGQHSDTCTKKDKPGDQQVSYHQTIRVEETKKPGQDDSDKFETYFAKPLTIDSASAKSDEEDEDLTTSSVTVNSEDLSSSPVPVKHNVSNVSISSDPDTKLYPSSAVNTPKKMTYITEIKVSPSNRKELDEDALSDSNEEIVSIMENSKKLSDVSMTPTSSVKVNVTSNGKLPAGKKPPVPPRRSDATRYVPKSDPTSSEKQIVYVSEYKSPVKEESKSGDGKKFENWIFVKDDGKEQEINPWGNGSGGSQPVTSIVLSSSSDDKIVRQ